MSRFESNKIDKSSNYFVRYVKWMVSGRYVRFLKMLYTAIWVTALATLNFEQFLTWFFGGFLARELFRLLVREDYEEESPLMRLAKN